MIDNVMKVIDWLTTTVPGQISSRIIAVFFVSELVFRQVAYKVLVFVDWPHKKEAAVIDLAGYLANLIFGILFAVGFRGEQTLTEVAMWGILYIGASLLLHMLYISRLEPWLKNRAKNKGNS